MEAGRRFHDIAATCLTVPNFAVLGRDGLKAVLSRQRQRSRQRGRGRGEARQRQRELEAEARQSEIDVVCVVLISCTMHM